MLKLSCLFLLLFLYSENVFAQTASYLDSIELVTSPFGGLKFYQHNKRLTSRDLANTIRPNAEAFAYLQKAKTNKAFSFATAFIGGALLGYQLANSLFGNKINWGVMGPGIAFTVASIPLGISVNRNAKKAVYLYNAAFR